VQVPPPRRSRGSTIAAGIAAAAAVLAATVTAVVVLTDDRGNNPAPPQTQGSSVANASPPSGVRLSDEGSSVTLTWSDPTDGTAAFIVAGGQAGEQQRAMGQTKAGETRYELNGLNANLNYCFVIIAVYSADQLLPSEQVCTARSTASPRSSGTGTGR
jgi:hypothetical protein